MPEAQAVREMFAGIASRYDLANRLLSMGIDVYWRRVLLRQVRACMPRDVADLACGSGDVTLALAKGLPKGTMLQGLDFCEPMLEQARRKHKSTLPETPILFAQGDCLNLPLTDASQDVLTIAFGLRNLEDRKRGLAEMRRVLRPGGSLFVLEFTQPDRWFRPFYYTYLKCILPSVAAVLTGDRKAYRYLAGSIEAFPKRETLAEELRTAGFGQVNITGLTFGIVAIHRAVN